MFLIGCVQFERLLLMCLVSFHCGLLIPQSWQGTALQAWLWRALGAKVGRNCCLFGGERLEMDLLHLGDQVIVGEGAILQVLLQSRGFGTLVKGWMCYVYMSA
jgi:hypothetical protein